MKASELIHKLSFEIMQRGDMDVSLEILDKDWNQVLVSTAAISVVSHLETIRLSIKPN